MIRRRDLLAAAAGWTAVPAAPAAAPAVTLAAGDVVFGSFPGSYWARVAASFSDDRSPFGHVAIVDAYSAGTVIDADGNPQGGKVRARSLAAFLEGADLVEVRRLRGAPAARRAMAMQARRWIGTPFDTAMTLGPDRLYCTELVWRACLVGCGLDLAPEKGRVGPRQVIRISDLRAAPALTRLWGGTAVKFSAAAPR